LKGVKNINQLGINGWNILQYRKAKKKVEVVQEFNAQGFKAVKKNNLFGK